MNKLLLIIISFGIYGCSQAPKNVVAQDGKNALQTTCSGIYVGWSRCYENASKSCPLGFNITEKEQYIIDHDLPVRVLTFRCN